ncbi:MAG TPA: amidohydrolase family protein [Lacipirellulaceae bacterium]
MAVSLQARIIFPVDRPPIEHGFVTIDGKRIVAVGANAPSGEVIDLGAVALLPGLVNAHTHLEFSHLSRPLGAPGMPLADWIRLVIAERGRSDDSGDEAIAAGLRESIRHGVTTIGEILAGNASPAYGEADVTAFVEVIGFSRARAQSALVATIERIHQFDRTINRIWLGVSPHTPYTVSPELLKQLVGMARGRGFPVAMHLAESADELELLESGTGRFQELLDERSMWDDAAIPHGSRPLDYLRMLAEAPRALVIHGNYLDEEECAFLAANSERMSLIHCPRTHSYFFHPPFQLSQLLANGVRVALGTDSRASTPDLDLLAEMRHVARLHPQLDPHDILRMGTLAGALALGRENEVGRIAPGTLANLVAIPVPEVAGATASDLLAAMFADGAAPRLVGLRGNLAQLTES